MVGLRDGARRHLVAPLASLACPDVRRVKEGAGVPWQLRVSASHECARQLRTFCLSELAHHSAFSPRSICARLASKNGGSTSFSPSLSICSWSAIARPPPASLHNQSLRVC